LPWEAGSFGVVYLLLVLSSLEDADSVRALLQEARRVVRPGGAIAVWEPRVPTPWNPRTRWIRRSELRAVLGRETESRAVTLLPPLARRLGSSTGTLYPVLSAVDVSSTHRVSVYRPGTGRPRALILVRKGVAHDARVHREVDAMASAGFEPAVLAVTNATEVARRGVAAGAPVLRVTPRSPAARARHRLRRRGRRPAPEPPSQSPVAASAAPARSPLIAAGHCLHRALTAADFHRQAIGAVRARRPELVHCNDWNTMWAGVASKLLGARVVYDSHELWPDRNGRPEWRPWLLAAEALFVRAADRVITTSPGYARVLAGRYRIDEPIVVRNVPTSASAPTSKSLGDPPVLAYAGGLLRGRGLEQAIDALARVPHVRLDLIGPGAPAYRSELTARAEQRGVADRVALRGPVPPESLVEVLSHADIGLCLIQPVCLSYELTLPNKLFEYAAAGLPILASDLPVIAAEVRRHSAGEVVDPADVEAIAAGLRRLLETARYEYLRRGVSAMASAARWPDERERLMRLYGRAGALD
jgi:glycosyltransferase involved in cell wall biosynthesis